MRKQTNVYEFETDSLCYSIIEEKITKYYDLGFAESSNFMELILGSNSDCIIITQKGSITFSALVGKKEGNYYVTIYPEKIKVE